VNEKNKGEADPRVELTPDDLKRIDEIKKQVSNINPIGKVIFVIASVFIAGITLFTLLFTIFMLQF
jgi:hypothetical protein